jgi:hypothetical protein
LVKPDPT